MRQRSITDSIIEPPSVTKHVDGSGQKTSGYTSLWRYIHVHHSILQYNLHLL